MEVPLDTRPYDWHQTLTVTQKTDTAPREFTGEWVIHHITTNSYISTVCKVSWKRSTGAPGANGRAAWPGCHGGSLCGEKVVMYKLTLEGWPEVGLVEGGNPSCPSNETHLNKHAARSRVTELSVCGDSLGSATEVKSGLWKSGGAQEEIVYFWPKIGMRLKGSRICHPKICHFGIMIIFSYRHLKNNKCREKFSPNSSYLLEERFSKGTQLSQIPFPAVLPTREDWFLPWNGD